jgi:hypothetical protein
VVVEADGGPGENDVEAGREDRTAGAGGGAEHGDGRLRPRHVASAREVEDELCHVVNALDVRPCLGAGVIGGLDGPEVDPVAPGDIAADQGDRVGVLVGGVPQRVQ